MVFNRLILNDTKPNHVHDLGEDRARKSSVDEERRPTPGRTYLQNIDEIVIGIRGGIGVAIYGQVCQALTVTENYISWG